MTNTGNRTSRALAPRLTVSRPLVPLAPAPAQQAQASVSQLRVPAFAQRKHQAASRQTQQVLAVPAAVVKKRRRARGEHPPLPGGPDYEERVAAFEERERQRQLGVPLSTTPQQTQWAPRVEPVWAAVPQQFVGNVAPYQAHGFLHVDFGGFQPHFPMAAGAAAALGQQQQMQASMPAMPLQPEWVGDIQDPPRGFLDPSPLQMDWAAAAIATGSPPMAPGVGLFDKAWDVEDFVPPTQQFDAAAPTPGPDAGFDMNWAIQMAQMAGHLPGPAPQFDQAVLSPVMPPVSAPRSFFDIYEATGDLLATPPGPVQPASESPAAAPASGALASTASSPSSLREAMTPPENAEILGALGAVLNFAADNSAFFDYAAYDAARAKESN